MWSHLSWCVEVAGGGDCISDVAHLFLCVSALSVQDNEYVGPSKVFLLDSEMSSTDPERNKIKNIHV